MLSSGGRRRSAEEREPSTADEQSQRARLRKRVLIATLTALPVLIAAYVLILVFSLPNTAGTQLTNEQFAAALHQGRITSATILSVDLRIAGRWTGGRYWVAYDSPVSPLYGEMLSQVQQANVPYEVDQQSLRQLIVPASIILPSLIIVDGILAAFVLFGVTSQPLAGFGRARARRFRGQTRITFADVAGLDEPVEELREVSDYLANPDRFASMGAAVPKGILLSGPPGCGKTLLARAVAGESEVPFFSISGSDFVEIFVGVGAARIRDLFEVAKESVPAIVFIDELDAVGRGRLAVGGQDEREATLNQLLVEMDGFESGSGVVVIAATNRIDVLDPALLRPGRFDRRVTVDPPDIRGRVGILSIHASGKPLAADVDLTQVARRTAGFSGADLANVVNEAAMLAARRGTPEIGSTHLLEAIERVVIGPERRSRILGPEDRFRLAVHEAGHAVVASALPSADPVEKVSIISRGRAGGMTWFVPEGEQAMVTSSQLRSRVTALLGGRAAEELLVSEVSSAAEDDLERATKLARWMVARLGMSDLGPISVGGHDGADGTVPPPSDELVARIDGAAAKLLEDSGAHAGELLRRHRPSLEALVARLVEDESVEGADLRAVLASIVGAPAEDVVAALEADTATPADETRAAT
ncbi:MAG TPA: ATP-dependent zinc metalloprotease FtsH [Solirubrobacteraceae bacterium]|nr:ATP-dependent zinc metalloprotease FtsH [Solirubrobacteraceae bacterium]